MIRSLAAILLSLAALALTACGGGKDFLLDEEMPQATGTPSFYQRTPPATPTPTAGPTAAGSCGETYIVEAGDAPYSIAEKCGVDVNELMKLNGIDDPKKLRIGQELRIPKGAEE